MRGLYKQLTSEWGKGEKDVNALTDLVDKLKVGGLILIKKCTV